MINLSKSGMKKILDEAPGGATHFDSYKHHGCYLWDSALAYYCNDSSSWIYSHDLNVNDEYLKKEHVFSLADIRKQLEGDIVTAGEFREISTSSMFKLLDFVNEHNIGEIGDSCVDLAIQALSEKYGIDQRVVPEKPVYTKEMQDSGELPPIGCMVKTENGIAKVVSTSTDEGGIVTYSWDDGANIACAWNNKSWINPIEKPETPQQREEREKEEAESEITDIINSMVTVNGCSTEEIAKAIVAKTKYRKEVE